METHFLARCAAALLLTVLACACSTEPPTGEKLEQRCQSWRNFARTKSVDYVLEECSHQMGMEQCKKCLEDQPPAKAKETP